MVISVAGCSESAAGVDGGLSTNPQEHYAYPGCSSDPRAGSGCPKLSVYVCALETIERKHDDCVTPGDCAQVTLNDCQGSFGCSPRFVNGAKLQAYSAEVSVEISAFCDGGHCQGSPGCGADYRQGRVDGVNSRCVALADCDGGSC